MTETENIKALNSNSTVAQASSRRQSLSPPLRSKPKNWLLNEDSREAFKAIVSFLGLGATAAAAIGIFISYQGSLEDRKLTQQRLMTERFSRSTELLASRERVTRIGAIYALERIAKDSAQDHGTIMELLSSYVLEKSPNLSPREEQQDIDIDVQSALIVIGRRSVQQDQLRQININLSRINATGAGLSQSKFNDAMFVGSQLAYVSFVSAALKRSSFWNANLNEANFAYADLSEADFKEANLSNAEFEAANLSNATFKEANLYNADFSKAKNLTKEQLTVAKLCKTKLPPKMTLMPNRDCPKQVK
jgi:uncharacterized protein YjbI with pentapeptide repeats